MSTSHAASSNINPTSAVQPDKTSDTQHTSTATTTSCVLLDWVQEHSEEVLPVNVALATFTQQKFAAAIHSVEYGAGGDCLFYSVAGALGNMLAHNAEAAEHVRMRLSVELFHAGKNQVMQELRRLSASQLSSWPPEALLDYLLRACMDSSLESFEDQWKPQEVMVETGFESLHNAESILAVEYCHDGAIVLRVARTQTEAGAGPRNEEIIRTENGAAHLAALRTRLQQELMKCGNWHWGTQFDVHSLCEALNVGILVFCNTLQCNGATCLYNIGSTREDYPYWIALWWHEPTHFRLASLDGVSFWSDLELPPNLREEFRRCNRLAK